MPQSFAQLSQMSAGYAPTAPGIAPSMALPFRGVPGLDNMSSPMGIAAQMALVPTLQRQMGQMGMMPMGVGHDQNVYDTMRSQQYIQAQQQAMKMAAESDRLNWMQAIRGSFVTAGTHFGPEQQKWAENLTKGAAAAAPFLAQAAPEYLDQLGGSRGSATVMAQRIMDAGRYRMDPLTGQMGMSADAAGKMSRQIYEDLYKGRDLSATSGLSAGQFGSLFADMQSRGMIRNAGSENNRGMLSPEEIDKLQLNPAALDKLRSFDAERVKRSVKEMTGAVAAMKDIFGDMGNPNAPIPELMKALDAMTGGSVGKIDKSKLAGIVRQTYNLAKDGGMSMDAALVIQQDMSIRAQQMGLQPIAGVEAANAGIGYGRAARAIGSFSYDAWGSYNEGEVTQASSVLNLQAKASNAANRAGLVMRIEKSAGGFEAGSEAAAYADAIKRGEASYVYKGKTKSVALSQEKVLEMMDAARGTKGEDLSLSRGDLREMLGQKFEQEEIITDLSIGDTIQKTQLEREIMPAVSAETDRVLRNKVRDRLMETGMKSGEAAKRAAEMTKGASDKIASGLYGLSREAMANDEQRTAAVSKMIADNIDPAVLAKMSPAERAAFLKVTSDQIYGANNAMLAENFATQKNLQQSHQLNSAEAVKLNTKLQRDTKFKSETQQAFTVLGSDSIIRGAMDALIDARPENNKGISEVLGRSLGGVYSSEIDKAMQGPVQAILAKHKEYEALGHKLAATTDPAEREQLTARRNVLADEIKVQTGAVSKIGAQFGLNGKVDPHAVAPEAPISPEHIKKVMANPGKSFTRSEAEAVLSVRRLDDLDRYAAQPGSATKSTRFAVTQETARLRAANPGMSEADATAAALVNLRKSANKFDDPKSEVELAAVMKSPSVKSEEEAKSLIWQQRHDLQGAPPEDVIEATMKEQGISREKALDLVNARRNAKLAGVTPEEFKRQHRGGGDSFLGKTMDYTTLPFRTLGKAVLSPFALAENAFDGVTGSSPYEATQAVGRLALSPFTATDKAVKGVTGGSPYDAVKALGRMVLSPFTAAGSLLPDVTGMASKEKTVADNSDKPISGHLTGTFRIEGDRVEMVAAAGSSRQFTPNTV